MTSLMHSRVFAPIGGPRGAVSLCAQLVKDIQHGFFARVHEGPAGDVLRVLKKFFGIGQFVHTATVPSCVFSGIPFHLNSVEAS